MLWKSELDAIVGARAHGQFAEILPRLKGVSTVVYDTQLNRFPASITPAEVA